MLVVVATVVPLLVAGPAGATSCVGYQGVTPQKLLAGQTVYETHLFEQHDLALVGTVTAIRTNDAQGGATRTTLDVHGGFNVAALPDALEVSSDDPGWMNGYAFQHGTTYFIPVQHPGPQGQPYYSFVCDPIFEVAGPEAAAELEAVAADNGVTVADIAAAQPPASGSGGMPVLAVVGIVGLALVVLLGVGGLALVVGRRREVGTPSSSGPDSPA